MLVSFPDLLLSTVSLPVQSIQDAVALDEQTVVLQPLKKKKHAAFKLKVVDLYIYLGI